MKPPALILLSLLALVAGEKKEKDELKAEESINVAGYSQQGYQPFGYEYHSNLGPGRYGYTGSTPLYYPKVYGGPGKFGAVWQGHGNELERPYGYGYDYGSSFSLPYGENFGSRESSYGDFAERLRERFRAGFSSSNILLKNIKSSNYYEGYQDNDEGDYLDRYSSRGPGFLTGFNFDFGDNFNNGLAGSYNTDRYGYMTGNGYGAGRYGDAGYTKRYNDADHTKAAYKEAHRSAVNRVYSSQSQYESAANRNKYVSEQYNDYRPPPPPVSIPVPVPVRVPSPVPVHIKVPSPVPVHIKVPSPVPVHIKVPSPVPVHIKVPSPVPVPVPYAVPVPVSFPEPQWQEGYGGGNLGQGGYGGGHAGRGGENLGFGVGSGGSGFSFSNFGGTYGIPNYVGLEANGHNRVGGQYIKYGTGVPPPPPLDLNGYLGGGHQGGVPYQRHFAPQPLQSYKQQAGYHYGYPQSSYGFTYNTQPYKGYWGQHGNWK